MKHLIEYAQIEFFKSNKYLELEGILSSDKFNELTSTIETHHSSLQKKVLDKSQLFLQMHDLFQKLPLLKRFLTSHAIATILSQLTNEKYFRLNFDQFLYYPMAKNYPTVLKIDSDLSFQGMMMGMMIQIEGNPLEIADHFPKKIGNIVFFDPSISLHLESFLEPTSTEILLVGYGVKDSRYRFKETDPHTHLLKNFGYGFGDPLSNAHHPVIFAK
jgi:hypothetical protein